MELRTEYESDRAVVECTGFSHLGTERGGRDGATAGDRLDDGTAAGVDGGSSDKVEHALLPGGDVGLQGTEGGVRVADGLLSEFGDELVVRDEQLAEQGQVARLGRGCRGPRGGQSERVWCHRHGRSLRAGREPRRSSASTADSLGGFNSASKRHRWRLRCSVRYFENNAGDALLEQSPA